MCRSPRPGRRAPRAWLLLCVALLAACAARAPAPPPLRAGTSGDYAPFSSIDAAGQRRGLDVAVASRLAVDLGRPLAWVPFTWPALDGDVANGAFDVAMGGVTMRPDRALLGQYTRPYATTGALAIVRAGDAARLGAPGGLDRPGLRLAVNGGGHLERLTRARFPRAVVVPQRENAHVPLALRNGAVDAAISDSAEAEAWLTPQTVALPPFSVDYKAYLLPTVQSELAATLDGWLMAREADGWLNDERRRWLGEEGAYDAGAATRLAVAALIGLRQGLMPGIAAAKRVAGLPIEDRDQEARVLARVRQQVPDDADRAAALYAQLIALAKTAQHAAPPRADPPPLDTSRAALARIDATLCRELAHLPVSTPAQWQAVLAPTLGAADAARVAAILAR